LERMEERKNCGRSTGSRGRRRHMGSTVGRVGKGDKV
jgi:hypothetical protein